MAQDPKTLTYRVRRLPPDIDQDGVIEALQQNLSTEDAVPHICVFSLARSLDSFETTRTKIATVTISPIPSQFEGKEEWSFIILHHDVEHHIIVDRHFLDFTVLNEVHDDDHILDCVAISGLGSHPFGSWQRRGDPNNFMWLRDGLTKDLPGIRTVIYGYDTHLSESKSFKSTYDIALTLVNRLNSVGFGWPSARPTVFLCHSLGGIIFKEAMVMLAPSSGQEPSIPGKLRAALFFGVPNIGMETSQLRAMVKGDPTEELIKDLAPNSRLSQVDSLFSGLHATRNFRLVSFYETETTKTVRFSGGRWSRTGPEIIMVEKNSAIQRCSRDPEDVYSIDRDHSQMVKFALGDVNYTHTLDILRRVLNQEDAYSGGFTRQTTDVSTLNEETDGQHEEEIQTPSVKQKAQAKRSRKRSKAILRSLRLDIFDRRLADISAQHFSTFEWIFRKDSLHFTSWLLKENGVYWIEGKPGAGKSTLMKYIYQNQQTMELLHQWSGPEKCIQASFFFHHRGSTAQKSFEGLLQSILYQILEQDPELCRRLPASSLPRKTNLNKFNWDLASLQQIFSWILSQRRFKRNICLFIDALDEFDGHLELISEFIASLIRFDTDQAIRCKICFSSRPRGIIRNHFNQYPTFKIHDHTKSDIRTYTEERLEKALDFEGALEPSTEAKEKVNRVADKIIDQADGVFLWVRLALDDIIKALSRGSSINDLELLLQKVPPELDDFYRSIVERIPHDFRWEAYLVLDVTLRADERIGLEELHAIIACWPCKTLPECMKQRQMLWPTSNYEPPSKYKRSTFVQKLRENCGGLIEIDEPGERMRLMHETVRAFLSNPAFRQLILGQKARLRPQNGYTELAKFFLTQVQYFDHVPVRGTLHTLRDYEYKELGKESARYCFLAETTSMTCQYELVDSFKPVNPETFPKGGFPPWFIAPGSSGIQFAVVANLLLYMRRKLEVIRDASQIDSNDEEPLFTWLCSVAASFPNEHSQNVSRSSDGVQSFPKERLYNHHDDQRLDYSKMAQLFLDTGVYKKALSQGFNPFEYFLSHRMNHERNSYRYRYYPGDEFNDSVVSILQGLIEKGVNPNLGLYEDTKTKSKSWRPLHFADGPIAQLLLRKNAEVNPRGPRGVTPLDVAIRAVGKHRNRWAPDAAQPTLELFIQNQGAISITGLKYLPLCISRLEAEGCNVENMRRLPERSREMRYLSSKDSLLAPVLRLHPKTSHLCLDCCGGCCGSDDDGCCGTGCCGGDEDVCCGTCCCGDDEDVCCGTGCCGDDEDVCCGTGCCCGDYDDGDDDEVSRGWFFR